MSTKASAFATTSGGMRHGRHGGAPARATQARLRSRYRFCALQPATTQSSATLQDRRLPMPKRRHLLLGSLLAVLVAAFTVVAPYWVMRPFRSQSPTELTVALGTLRLAPWLLAPLPGPTLVAVAQAPGPMTM
jgi:hypothetical protein